RGRVRRVGAVSEAGRRMDPARAYAPCGAFVLDVGYDTLVGMNPQAGSIYPELATDWTVSADGTVYTFTLRGGVRFSTGKELTAADEAFSFRRLKNLKGNPSFLAAILQVVQADEHQ